MNLNETIPVNCKGQYLQLRHIYKYVQSQHITTHGVGKGEVKTKKDMDDIFKY